MTTFATGSETEMTYWEEGEFGVTPDAPIIKAFRGTMGSSFSFKRDTFSSNELSRTQQEMSMAYGTKQGSFSLPFDFSYASFDDFLEAMLGGTWTANVLKCGTLKRSFGFEDNISEIGVYEQNLGAILTGMSLAVKSNAVVSGSFDGLFRDQRVSQTVGAELAFDDTANTITRSAGSWVEDGFAIGDIPVFSGAEDSGNNVSTFKITGLTATVITLGDADGMVTASATTGATVNLGTIGTAAVVNTNEPFDSFTGVLSEGGTELGYITGIDMNLSREAEAAFAILKNDADLAQSVTRGKFTLTGTLTAYFVDQTFKKKFLNGTSTSMAFTLGDGSGKSYKFEMGKVYFSSNERDRQEKNIIETVEFKAIYDTTDESTMKITRIP